MLASLQAKLAGNVESGHVGECWGAQPGKQGQWPIPSRRFSEVLCFSGGVLSKPGLDHPAGTAGDPYEIKWYPVSSEGLGLGQQS